MLTPNQELALQRDAQARAQLTPDDLRQVRLDERLVREAEARDAASELATATEQRQNGRPVKSVNFHVTKPGVKISSGGRRILPASTVG